MVLQRFKIPEVMWIWNPRTPETKTLLQMSVAWSYGVKLLSACLLTQKTTWQSWGQRNEGREGRGWSLLKLAWLLKTLATLCNSILISLSSSIGTAIPSLYGKPYLKLCMNTVLHPKLECLDFLYKGSIGTAVPAVVTWDLVCAADWFGLEHSLLYVIWALHVLGTTVIYRNLQVRLSG